MKGKYIIILCDKNDSIGTKYTQHMSEAEDICIKYDGLLWASVFKVSDGIEVAQYRYGEFIYE